jgi:hypothetical protein
MGKHARRDREGNGRDVRRDLPDFSTLPERVRPEDLRTTTDVDPGPDPQGGRDTETEFMLRYAGP